MAEDGLVRTYYDSDTETWVESRPAIRAHFAHIGPGAHGIDSIRGAVEAMVQAQLAAWFSGNDFDLYGDRKTWWEEVPEYEYEEDEDGMIQPVGEPIGYIWRFFAEQGYWPEVITEGAEA